MQMLFVMTQSVSWGQAAVDDLLRCWSVVAWVCAALLAPNSQELTVKALQVIRKLVEMENKVEDHKPSVLEWDTVGDDPEVCPCLPLFAGCNSLAAFVASTLSLHWMLCTQRSALAWVEIRSLCFCVWCGPLTVELRRQTLRKVQLEMLAVGAPAVMIRLISMSGDKTVVHAAIVVSIAMLYVATICMLGSTMLPWPLPVAITRGYYPWLYLV